MIIALSSLIWNNKIFDWIIELLFLPDKKHNNFKVPMYGLTKIQTNPSFIATAILQTNV